MIPDFKTYIGESVWNDIRKRGIGSDVKEEDDVNHMDFDTFADYIEDNYSEKGNWFAIRESEDGKSRHIEIDIIYRKEIDLTFNVVEGEIYNILVNGNKSYVDIPGLKQIFNVNIIGSSTFSVYEKNWTISNNTFVKLIEFFLDKKTTNESVWNDIRRRGNGSDAKQENIIEDIFNYLDTNYTKTVFADEKIKFEDDTIVVPLFKCPFLNAYCDLNIDNVNYVKFSTINPNGYDLSDASSMMKSTIRDLKPVLNNLYEKLDNTYTIIDKSEFDGLDHWYDFKIKPKDDGKITKEFCVELIEFILDNIGKKIQRVIKRK